MTFYKFAVGVVLAIAMVAVLSMSALVFSSRDFQFGVAQVSPSTNGLVDFHRLAEVDREIARINAETTVPRGQLAQVTSRITALDNQARAATEDANRERGEIVGAIAQVERHSNVAGANADTSAQGLSQRIVTLAGRPGLSSADQQSLVALRARADNLAQSEQGADDAQGQRATLLASQRVLEAEMAEPRARIFALQQSVVPDYEHYQRVSNEARALMTLSPLGVSAYLAQGHPALLSTCLVLLMGALGSLLYLFPAYLNRPAPVTMAEIAVRLIFGMCAALAFYVLANAAVAGFSIGAGVTQATTSSLLNPFTVSLVGIVAGVLSEDIAHWIQERGRGIFTQGQISSGAAGSGQAAAESPTGGLVNNQAIS
jgi:hypothetical protein